ncbi:hypothetical protein [Streptomyces wuyuanensis]|uniref:hypothetical protein n=1 Tax=Streptomyces wuyuanensis TaxID=1196353 RepID=UPI00371F5868
MAQRRVYQVNNVSALFESGTVIEFPHDAPAGSIVTHVVDGRPVRVLLTDTPLSGGRYAAEFVDCYL